MTQKSTIMTKNQYPARLPFIIHTFTWFLLSRLTSILIINSSYTNSSPNKNNNNPIKDVANPLHLVHHNTQTTTTSNTAPKLLHDHFQKTPILIIDVDNTLYNEKRLKSQFGLGIEEQIIQNIHSFAFQYFNLTREQSNLLHTQYGSTIEGIRQTFLTNNTATATSNTNTNMTTEKVYSILEQFYNQVYSNINLSSLYSTTSTSSTSSSSTTSTTGYNHENINENNIDNTNIIKERKYLRELIHSIPYPIYFASNSPSYHVYRILSTLGLSQLVTGSNRDRIITPDTASSVSFSPSLSIHSNDAPKNKHEQEQEPEHEHEHEHDNQIIESTFFPTKSNPYLFYKRIIEKYPITTHRLILIDDSHTNLKKAIQVGIEGILVNDESDTTHNNNKSSSKTTLEEAIHISMGHIPPKHNQDIHSKSLSSPSSSSFTHTHPFVFNDVEYLKAKNIVDKLSINTQVWARMGSELAQRLLLQHSTTVESQNVSSSNNSNNSIRILDVGAGLLFFIEMILLGDGDKKQSLVTMLMNHGVSPSTNGDTIEYLAYEPNRQLLDATIIKLKNLQFHSMNVNDANDSNTSSRVWTRMPDDLCPFKIIVTLMHLDFMEEDNNAKMILKNENPHLIVGCCFADLLDPYALTTSLQRFIHKFSDQCNILSNSNNCDRFQNGEYSPWDTLIYFPITFTGATHFHPPKPFETVPTNSASSQSRNKIVPSDTFAFQLYAQSLISHHGHNLNQETLIDAIQSAGGLLLDRGPSNWIIDVDVNSYLWETMLYFFGSTASLDIMKRHMDSTGWLKRARMNRPTIFVQNIDLLFSLPMLEQNVVSKEYLNRSNEVDGNAKERSSLVVEEIVFTAPYNVTKSTKIWNTTTNEHLGPGQIEVRSVCSLISSGTELKIFKGMFEEAALDLNIKGMSETTMKYPLSYGYSLVGIVTKCAPDVTDRDDIIGRLVFTFSPHSSHVIVDRNSVQIVPESIAPEDAIFMPSVETALSIVHDANIRIGEKIAIFGQGIIGLLVNAILSLHKDGDHDRLTVFDTICSRLAMASRMGSTQALVSSDMSDLGPFDVAIEVSGNPKALQSAIDSTRTGGRVIIGSWYGDKAMNLKLGIDFHRSHKVIKTSQVSIIPPELSLLWNKKRRFDVTWELTKILKPSNLITRKLDLADAQLAYDLLNEGKEIAICFSYP